MTTSTAMSRRDLFRWGAAASAGAALVAVGAGADPAGARPGGPPHHTSPDWARRWSSPIYSTADYDRHCPHERPMPHRGLMLTIDDGPSPDWTPAFLDLLKHNRVRATFCLIGENVVRWPGLVRDIVRNGHRVANHSWSHPENLPYLSKHEIWYQVRRTQRAIEHACGVQPRQFRAPGGNFGPDVFDELARQKMMPLAWDIDPRDWALPGTSHIISAMLAAGPRDIILCHDGGGDRSETHAALRTVLPALKRRGLEFVVLPDPQL